VSSGLLVPLFILFPLEITAVIFFFVLCAGGVCILSCVIRAHSELVVLADEEECMVSRVVHDRLNEIARIVDKYLPTLLALDGIGTDQQCTLLGPFSVAAHLPAGVLCGTRSGARDAVARSQLMMHILASTLSVRCAPSLMQLLHRCLLHSVVHALAVRLAWQPVQRSVHAGEPGVQSRAAALQTVQLAIAAYLMRVCAQDLSGLSALRLLWLLLDTDRTPSPMAVCTSLVAKVWATVLLSLSTGQQVVHARFLVEQVGRRTAGVSISVNMSVSMIKSMGVSMRVSMIMSRGVSMSVSVNISAVSWLLVACVLLWLRALEHLLVCALCLLSARGYTTVHVCILLLCVRPPLPHRLSLPLARVAIGSVRMSSRLLLRTSFQCCPPHSRYSLVGWRALSLSLSLSNSRTLALSRTLELSLSRSLATRLLMFLLLLAH
jgi:hypothetical protein